MNRQSGNRREEQGHVLYDRVHDGDRVDTLLNPDTDDELLCRGYRPCSCGDFIHYLLCLLTCGGWLLVAYWRPDWRLKLTHSPCRMSQATMVLLQDYYKQMSVATVQVVNVGDGPDLEYTSKRGQRDHDDHSSDDDTACLTETTEETWFLRYFDFQNIRYIWDPDSCAFLKLCGLESGVKCLQLHEDYTGFSRLLQQRKRILYGTNSIDIEVQSYPKLFVSEVLNPFYIFQVLSVALWMSDEYYYYAACIIVISFISITVSLIETRRQSETLHDMVSSKESSITVCRGNSEFEQVATADLVPGDVISIPATGCMMSCDAVLLTGNCIVNESMLTGESVPVTKTPLMQQEDDEIYSPDLHKRHTLFSGTQVIQTRYYGQAKVMAVVVQTGFSTAKGSLVRAILFPKPIDFKFYSDAIRFILFMGCIASIGMAYTLYIMISYHIHPFKVFLRTMDIITIVVPPALPAAMTVGMVYAQSRLKKQGIFCISPPRINMSGLLDVVCFDKTGTLTEDGLDLLGVVPLQGRRFLHNFQDTSELPRGPFLATMATCHSLTRIAGELSGDPLDLKMFLSTNWVLEEPSDDTTRFDSLMPTVVRPPTNDSMYSCLLSDSQTPYEIGVVRQFTFSSSLQRMSVITRTLGETHMDLYTKGAPEKVASLCLPSTVPEDFHEVLHRYTLQGLRVIAAAWKPLDPKLAWHQAQKIHRDQLECDLRFLGFLIMQNTLKPVTTSIIHQLQMADLRTVMVTGDNMLTAVSVARECRMIQPKDRVVMVNAVTPDGDRPAQISWEYAESGLDNDTDTGNESDMVTYQSVMIEDPGSCYHFAVSGKSYEVVKQHFPELMQKLCVRGTVFARMSPDQKSQLIEELQEMNYMVGMCGDGANDCGALKTAHTGISLSEAEASVASPFTSKTPNIQCVPTVVREGRAALVTSFGVFKYMALYSMIQFISVIILYNIEQNLGDTQFLYLDLVVTTTVAFLMGHTAAYSRLVAERPPGHLLSVPVLFSIVVQILVQLMCQVAVFEYIRYQPWFVPHHSDFNEEPTTKSFEGTLIFCYTAFQYLICAVCFSKGPPYRKRIWTNVPFTVSLIILTLLTAFLWMYPFKFIQDFLAMIYIHDAAILFKVTILMIVCGNLLISVFIEEFITDSWLLRNISSLIRPSKSRDKLYKQIETELDSTVDWPPVGQVTMSAGGSLVSSLNDLSVN